jgi:hypothetical protein
MSVEVGQIRYWIVPEGFNTNHPFEIVELITEVVVYDYLNWTIEEKRYFRSIEIVENESAIVPSVMREILEV